MWIEKIILLCIDPIITNYFVGHKAPIDLNVASLLNSIMASSPLTASVRRGKCCAKMAGEPLPRRVEGRAARMLFGQHATGERARASKECGAAFA